MKQKMKKYISLLIVLLTITWSGCKKDYLELSNSPNSPQQVNPNQVLSGALGITASILNGYIRSSAGTVTDANYTMYANWVGYLSWSTNFQPNVTLLQYAFTNSNYDVWSRLYLNISNYQEFGRLSTNPNNQAIAKIMIALDFQQLVDNYNDVPYTNSMKGTENLTPTYDKGSAIYDDLIIQLDAAIKMIQAAPTGTATPAAGDVMFQGNMTNWIKFANTLKLRIALRQSNLSAKQGALKTAISATEALGYLGTGNPATVNPGYANSDSNGGQQSPLFYTYGTTQAGGSQDYRSRYIANQYGINFYTSHVDPRDTLVYNLNDEDKLVGTFLGQTSTTPANQTPSRLGPGALKGATMDAVIMSAAEVLFLQAEAASTGLISGTAATLYAQGVLASFKDDLVPNADAAAVAYLALPQNSFPLGGSLAAQQKAIIVQKWAALNPYGAFEAFNELRRTGYPDDIPLSVYPGTNPPNQIARILYPTVEYQTNAINVAAQGPIDKYTSKIFWAK